jgi:hypothetical protein
LLFALLFLTFLMLFFIPDLHPHELHISYPFATIVSFQGHIPKLRYILYLKFEAGAGQPHFLTQNSLGYLPVFCRIDNEGPIKGDKIGVSDTK